MDKNSGGWAKHTKVLLEGQEWLKGITNYRPRVPCFPFLCDWRDRMPTLAMRPVIGKEVRYLRCHMHQMHHQNTQIP